MAISGFIRLRSSQPVVGAGASLRGRQSRLAATRFVTRSGRLAGQAALLSLIYIASSAVVDLVHVPVPGNLLALLVLLVLLTSGVLRLAYVEELATFLLRHLTFFFVPFTVGLLAQSELLAASGVALLMSLIVAVGTGIVVAGAAAQLTVRWTGDSYADH